MPYLLVKCTYEQKNDVVERYRTSITAFGSQYNKIYPNQTPKEQRVGLDMLSRSLTKASTYEVQANIAQFTETNADLQLRLKLNLETFSTKQAIDPITELRKGKELLGQMFEIGAMTKNQYDSAFDQYVTSAYTERSKLMGRQMGRDVAEGKTPKYMDKAEVLAHIGAMVSIDGNLDKSRASEVYEAFTIAKTAKLRELITADSNNEQMSTIIHRKELGKRILKYAEQEEQGALTLKDHDEFVKFLDTSGLHGEKRKYNNNWVKWQGIRPIDDIVTNWVSQDGVIALALANGTASGSDYGMYNTATNSYDINAIDKLIRAKGITHEPTIVAVKAFYRNTHKALSQGYNGGTQAKLEIKTVMTQLMGQGDIKQFGINWGVDSASKQFDFDLYTKSQGGILAGAKQHWTILQDFENEMLGAIQADIAGAAGTQRIDQGKSIPHLSDYSDKKGQLKTPFSTTIDENNNPITWEQRTNTPLFRQQFKQYVNKLQVHIRQNLKPDAYWENAKKVRQDKMNAEAKDTEKRKIGMGDGK